MIPTATIIAPAELLSDVARLIAAGANHVMVPRLGDGRELLSALQAWENGTLDEAREALIARLAARKEVLR